MVGPVRAAVTNLSSSIPADSEAGSIEPSLADAQTLPSVVLLVGDGEILNKRANTLIWFSASFRLPSHSVSSSFFLSLKKPIYASFVH